MRSRINLAEGRLPASVCVACLQSHGENKHQFPAPCKCFQSVVTEGGLTRQFQKELAGEIEARWQLCFPRACPLLPLSRGTVLVCSGCHHKIPWTGAVGGGCLNNSSVDWKSKIKLLAGLMSGDSSLLGWRMATFSL